MVTVGSGAFYVLIAMASAIVGLALARLVLRLTPLRGPFDFGPVEAMVGIVYGILLAILVLFASQHYTSAITDANNEATALNGMFKSAGVLAPATRDTLRHEIVCFAREEIDLEWPILRKSNGTGSPQVFARTQQIGSIVEQAAREQPQNLTVSTLYNAFLQRGEARQLLIEDSRPTLPYALWAVVLIGIGTVVFLLALRYWEEPTHLAIAVGVSLLILLAMVFAIAELDRPFAPLIGLEPRAVETVITNVVQSSTHGAAALRPCAPLS